MPHTALGAIVGAAALLAVAPGGASGNDVGGRLVASGALTVRWSGDPARGCAAAGLCGYSGSLHMVAARRRGEYHFSVVGRRLRGDSGVIRLRAPPAVRVQRKEGGARAGTCNDRAEEPFLFVIARRARRGRARFAVRALEPSAGRCAGPSPLYRVLRRLPARTVSLKRASKGGTTLDLSGSARYGAGHFSGTVRSTLKLRLGKAAPSVDRLALRRPVVRQQSKPLLHVVDLSAVYRVTDFSGALSTSFGGLRGAPCTRLDACGVAGSTAWRLDGVSRGTVEVGGVALARRSDHGLRGAIAALRRRNGIVDAYASLPYVDGTTTAEVTRPGGVTCHDRSRVGAPGLDMLVIRKPPRLLIGGVDTYDSDGDLIRAGCPGPRDVDALGRRPIGSGPLRLSSLAHRTFDVHVSGSRQFSGPGYSGSSQSRFTLRLQRVRIHATYRRSPYLVRPLPPR
jgi:hypothetical protein